jgi:hypothetical protein
MKERSLGKGVVHPARGRDDYAEVAGGKTPPENAKNRRGKDMLSCTDWCTISLQQSLSYQNHG